VAAFMAAVSLQGWAEGPRILLYLRDNSGAVDYMLTHEVGVMIEMLEKAGLQFVVATPWGRSVEGSTATLKADLSLREVRVSDYAGFLLPCMAAGAPGYIHPEAIEMVKEAAAQGKPVAAQYGSVFTLARAGLLSGRRYAFGWAAFAEGIFSGTGVVGDGSVFTSGTCSQQALETGRPDGTAELTRMFIEAVASGQGQP
jgi:putative intracellular protease/amidase